MYRIEAKFADYQEPEMHGYKVADYFRDRGSCLEQDFETYYAAVEELNRQYRGPDVDGVAPAIKIIET